MDEAWRGLPAGRGPMTLEYLGTGVPRLHQSKEDPRSNLVGPAMGVLGANAQPSTTQTQRGARNRTSLSGLGSELGKLRAEFNSLQQQLHQMPASTPRRESVGPAPILEVQAPGSFTSDAMPTVPAPEAPALARLAPPAPRPVRSLIAQATDMELCSSNTSVQHAGRFSAPAADLAARAASIADCPLGGREQQSGGMFQFPSSVPDDSQTWRAAKEMFLDTELTSLCEEVLTKQLQRTKDGATEQSRIQELAVLVKHLRKAVRELGSRASMYVDQCIRLEREQMKQVEGLQLAGKSAMRSLEAELAGVKKSLAGVEAGSKAERANLGAELEGARFEAARMKRELERVTEERDRAREEATRADQQRQQAELELKELRKMASQQMREVAATQGEVVRSISDEKAAAERREASLKEESSRLTQRLEAASSCVEALQGELALLQQVHESVRTALRAKTMSEEEAHKQSQQLRSELPSVKAQLAQATGDLAVARAAVEESRSQVQRLSAELVSANAAMTASQQQVALLSNSSKTLQAATEEERRNLKTLLAAAEQREAALAEEKSALKAALAAALKLREDSESAMAQAQRECLLLSNQCMNLKHQVEFVAGQQAEAERQAVAYQSELKTAKQQLDASQAELATKEDQLGVMEGEFAALKEVLGEAGGQRDVVASLLTKISALQTAVAAAEATRRKLHNELVCIRGNIRVYCRVKPHPASVVRCAPDQSGVAIAVDGKEHTFAYDKVFTPGTAQEDVFASVSELVQSALDGYHVCLFSYGQTGAGKTYTMQGTDSPAGRGIIPRAVEKILDTAAQLQEQCEWEYSMEASFVEVYNNSLRDLLGGPSSPYINDQSAIKHDAAGGHTTVTGVSKVPISDAGAANALIRRAAASRACEATAMNAESSRSHSVFMLYITGSHAATNTRLQGCLCLVDLAGSERLDRSQVEDARKKEACAINQSLSALGDIFAALSSKNAHVPYRNSKLTYLLQPCLGGQGKTLMFVNINPEPASASESLFSLKFAAKVNGCETAAKGGARRNAGGAGALATGAQVPSQMAAAGAVGDSKRMSLPGVARQAAGQVAIAAAAAAAAEPVSKRASLHGGAGGSGASHQTAGAVSGAVKRPPPAPAALGQQSGTLHAAKRMKI